MTQDNSQLSNTLVPVSAQNRANYPRSGYLGKINGWWPSLGVKNQITILAIAGSSLPVLALGISNYYLKIAQDIPTIFLGSGVTAVVAGIAATLLFKRAMNPLNNSLAIVDRLGQGKFTLNDSQDEFCRLETNIYQLSNHLQNLAQEQAKSIQQRQLFSSLGFRTRETNNLHTLLETAVEGARELLATDRVIVYKFNPDGSGTVIAESIAAGFPKAMNDTIVDPCFQQRHAAQYQAGQITTINDVNSDPKLTDCYIRLLQKYKVKANLVVPIRQNEKLYGLLIAHQCSAPRIWQKSEIGFLSQLATEFEYHLDYINFFNEQQLNLKQRKFLSNIAFRVRQTPTTETLFHETVKGARDFLKTDRITIYKFNPDWSGTMIAESVGEGFTKALDNVIFDPCFHQRHAAQYQAGQITTINDVDNEPKLTDCYRRLLEQYQVKANLVVPIRQNEKLYGLLIAHHCCAPRIWQEAEIGFLSELATEVEYHLEYINFSHKQQFVAKQKQLLSNIAFRTRQSPHLHVLLESSVEGARDVLHTDRVVVYKFNPDWSGKIIAESVAAGLPKTINETIGDPCFEERHANEYQNGRIKVIDDIYNEPGLNDCHIQFLEQYKVKANLIVPIRMNDGLYGLLIAHHCSSARHWEQLEIDFLSQLATEIEYSLTHIHFIEEQEASSERAWFFGDITFRARQSLNLEEIFQTTVGGARKILKTDRVLVYKFNPDWSGTMVAESVGEGLTKVLDGKIDDPCFRGRYVELYKNGRVRAINSIQDEPGLTDCHIRTLEKYEVKANLVAPLRKNGELMGLLIAHHCSSIRTWEKSEISFFSELATQVEYAIDHLSFIEKLKGIVQRSRLFGDIAFRARQSLEVEDIYRNAVQGARTTLNTDRVLIYRFNPDWSGTMIAESVGEEWPEVLNEKIDDPCFRGRYVNLYRDGRVRAINDIYHEPGLTDCHIRTLEQYQVKANLVVPIRRNNKLFALLIAHQCSDTRLWQKAEIDFFSELATQIEYALDHIIFIEELEQARQTAEIASQEQREQKETIQHQLDGLLEDVHGAFQGDLTVRATVVAGEIAPVAEFLNEALKNLQGLVLKIQAASRAVIETAYHSSQDIQSLSNEAKQASETVSISLDHIQRMTDSIQKVAANAKEAKLRVEQADRTLQEGDEAMNQTVDGILTIQDTVEETAEKIKRLGEASQKISRVVSLIRDLANQTQVLALNASIEADGINQNEKGFAVVAEEVRSLSERSTAAAEEIEQIVEEIQTETNQVVIAMETGREKVINGTQLVETTRQKLISIAAVSSQIRELVQEMAQAAIEQANTSASVSSTMQEVEIIAQKTSEQSVAGAQSFTRLLGVAKELQKSVAQFKVK